MEYIVACNGSAERILYADGTESGMIPGGAGLFALAAIRLWTDRVLLCAGFGRDYLEQIGGWLNRNRIDLRGFNVRDEKNPVNTCVYKNAEEWDSYTEYGDEHYDSLDCFPDKDHLRDFLPGAKGVYILRGGNPVFWKQIVPLRREFGFRLMWEIKPSLAVPDQLPAVRELARHVDAFSINRQEAFRLFRADCDEAVIEALRAFRLPLVVYRVGEEGLYVLLRGECLFAPSFRQYGAVDVTGCGNASTAAALYAFCEGEPIEKIAAIANVTAGHTLRFVGPPELSEALRETAGRQADQLARQLKMQGASI